MDAFTDPEVEEVWLCKPAQCGGTEAEYNILGYIIEQDPGPTMIVYPDEKFATRMSKTRIQPMIQNCPTLRAKYIHADSSDLELHFTDMTLILAWAGSPAAVAGAPCRYVILDEVAKFPSRSGREANSIALAYDRTKTFESSRKIVGTSTPVLETDQFYRRRKMADQVLRYFVPCPHCGCEQVMSFRGGVKWPHGCDASEAYDLVYYQCESCQGKVNEAHKAGMVRSGRWRAIDRDKGGLAAGIDNGGSGSPAGPLQFAPGSHRAIWLEMSSLPSPFVRIGEMARSFLRCKDYPEELQDFINSALGEPWRNTIIDIPSNVIMSRQTDLPEGVVAPEAMLLTAGVDVQQNSIYWTIRAWGPLLTSWNVAHGQCLSLWDVEPIMNRTWSKPNGEEFLVSLAAIDSGDQTDDVYDFCCLNPDWAIPVKGGPPTMQTFFRISIIDRVGSRAQGTRLVLVNGANYKTMIMARMQRENGRGSWMVHADCDQEYANQVTAEKQEIAEINGREVKTWKPKSSHAANHYLDAEVYCACAADLMQVRFLEDREAGVG